MNVPVLCLMLAFVLFLLAALGVSARINLTALGLATWVAAELFEAVTR